MHIFLTVGHILENFVTKLFRQHFPQNEQLKTFHALPTNNKIKKRKLNEFEHFWMTLANIVIIAKLLVFTRFAKTGIIAILALVLRKHPLLMFENIETTNILLGQFSGISTKQPKQILELANRQFLKAHKYRWSQSEIICLFSNGVENKNESLLPAQHYGNSLGVLRQCMTVRFFPAKRAPPRLADYIFFTEWSSCFKLPFFCKAYSSRMRSVRSVLLHYMASRKIHNFVVSWFKFDNGGS